MDGKSFIMLSFCHEKIVKCASFSHPNTGEVRHLLLELVNGHVQTDLILFVDGIESKVFSGTEYESRKKADELGSDWANDEGFTWAQEDEPPCERLEHAIKLAMRLGHNKIYDFNAIVTVPLKDWPGVQAKNGGSYKYAVMPLGIVAKPQLSEGYPKELTTGDIPQQLARLYKAMDEVGKRIEFLFADDGSEFIY
jgi:hypothetical protein